MTYYHLYINKDLTKRAEQFKNKVPIKQYVNINYIYANIVVFKDFI